VGPLVRLLSGPPQWRHGEEEAMSGEVIHKYVWRILGDAMEPVNLCDGAIADGADPEASYVWSRVTCPACTVARLEMARKT